MRPRIRGTWTLPKWMASPTWTRRVFGLACVGMFLLGLGWWVDARIARLVDTSFATGWILLTGVFALAMFGVRKRFPAPPIGTAAMWAQIHVYTALAIGGVFFLHAGFRLPTGWIDTPLWGVFLATFLSGLIGLWMSRTTPPKLAALREQAIYERIPRMIREIVREARSLVADETAAGAELLAAWREQVRPFLEAPRSWGYSVRPTGDDRRRVVARLRDVHRYLDLERRELARQLELLVCRKDDLDFHTVLQGRLKVWVVWHAGLTVALLTLAVAHMVVAHGFAGGST